MPRFSVASMPASSMTRTPARPVPVRTQLPLCAVPLTELSRARFTCEGEDALLTGMTRSPLRRAMALNLGGSLLAAVPPRPVPVSVLLFEERIA